MSSRARGEPRGGYSARAVKVGGEVPGGLIYGWEQEVNDLKCGYEVAETMWQSRLGWSWRAGVGGVGDMDTKAGYCK